MVIIDGERVLPATLQQYDVFSGELQVGKRCALFGCGIGYPQYHVDGGGTAEPWVGFKRTILQVELMVVAAAEADKVDSDDDGAQHE